MSQSKPSVPLRCPHLGLVDDQFTAYSYPSPNHRCAKVEVNTPLKQEYQLQFCLSPRHQNCPVYDARKTVKELPSAAQAEVPPRFTPAQNSYLIVISFVALFLLLSGFLLLIATQF